MRDTMQEPIKREPPSEAPPALAAGREARRPLAPASPGATAQARRGRPLEMPPATVLERIRRLSERSEGLFRVHHTHSSLYARSRRLFGSWAKAVAAAGVDYAGSLSVARRRSIESRRRRRRSAR